MQEQSIVDLRDVCRDTVCEYANQLADAVDDESLARSTAVNRLSSVNVLLSTARADDQLKLSPREWLGQRSYTCTKAPNGLNAKAVDAAAENLRCLGQPRLALAVSLCRYLGLRIREACLLNLKAALRSARRNGKIRITAGTKGGRGASIPRDIVPPDALVAHIDQVARQIDESNVIPTAQRFSDWYARNYKVWRGVGPRYGLKTGFHDLRRSYACERYLQLTGYEAPCVAGSRIADADADLDARMIIAQELGHGRPSIAAAYIGGRR